MKSNIIILDIETSPNIAYVWGAWKQNIGHNQWLDKTSIMSFAVKILDHEPVAYYDIHTCGGEKNLIFDLLMWLNFADVVVTHNGKKFDIPMILGRGVVHGFTPPSPFHQVDTYQIAKQEFRFVSNSLKVVADTLGVAAKDDHKKFPGFELWVECLKNNPEAWEEMKKYNVQDVITLEQVYKKFLPYIRNHPNVNKLMEEDTPACPKCGSHHIERRGYYTTAVGIVYHRFVCKECGGWGRSKSMTKDKVNPAIRNAR